ncbi:MAG: hypothetical protein IT340_03185 [Chloroflexi bacterium]|nr:hypothetical protein [Chloroflexota bacterium]
MTGAMPSAGRIGEIIATSTVEFTAQSHDLHRLPPLGTLVQVTAARGSVSEIVGVVAFGETAALDSGRRPVRRGNDDVFDDAVYTEHPELRHVLRTTFRARIVGFVDGDHPRRYLPPAPPPLHFSVRPCSALMTIEFTDSLVYLRTLLAGDGLVSPEQLLAAHIRETYRVRDRDEAWLAAAGREVARLLKGDYDRLLTVLQAIDPVVMV